MNESDRIDLIRKIVAICDAGWRDDLWGSVRDATAGGPKDDLDRHYRLKPVVFERATFAAQLFNDDTALWLDAACEVTLPDTRQRLVWEVVDVMYERLQSRRRR